MSTVRPLRGCQACGKVDDHPRHVADVLDGSNAAASQEAIRAATAAAMEHGPDVVAAVLPPLLDGATYYRHLDCCAEAGCPDGSCAAVMRGADGRTGQALVDYIVKGK